jgi:hypothetical protein
MRPLFFRALLLIVTLAVAASSCTSQSNIATPTEPTVVTEAFSGTVSQAGANYHVINAKPGEVVTTLTELGPDPAASIGLSVGVLNSLACTALMENSTAKLGSQLTGMATGIVTLCIRVYDAGTLTSTGQTVTYSIAIKYTK